MGALFSNSHILHTYSQIYTYYKKRPTDFGLINYKKFTHLISACFSRKLSSLGKTSFVQRRQIKSWDVSAITTKVSTAY